MPPIPNRDELVRRVHAARERVPRPSLDRIARELNVSRSFVATALRETPSKKTEQDDGASGLPSVQDDGAGPSKRTVAPPADLELHDPPPKPAKKTRKPSKKTVQDDGAGPSKKTVQDDSPPVQDDSPAAHGGERHVELHLW